MGQGPLPAVFGRGSHGQVPHRPEPQAGRCRRSVVTSRVPQQVAEKLDHLVAEPGPEAIRIQPKQGAIRTLMPVHPSVSNAHGLAAWTSVCIRRVSAVTAARPGPVSR